MPATPSGLKIVNDEGDFESTSEYLEQEGAIDVSRPPKSKERNPPRPPPADKPLDAKLTQTELEKALCSIYNLVNRLLKVPTRYRPGEFNEEADGLMSLINQFARLRVIGRLLGPIAAVGAMWDKIEDTTQTLAKRRAARKQTAVEPASPNAGAAFDFTGNGATESKAAFKP